MRADSREGRGVRKGKPADRGGSGGDRASVFPPQIWLPRVRRPPLVCVPMSELKRTPLRDFHAQHGARLVDFAGWEMPVQYRSILEEHKAVRRTAGLFDVSHMGEVDVRGADAGRFLNHLVTNDVAKLFPGRVLYSPMCYPPGGVVDDLLVYMRSAEDYFLCI